MYKLRIKISDQLIYNMSSSLNSALSGVSITFRGSEVNIEQALDEVIRGLQEHLNDLQYTLRSIAMSTEQLTDDGLADLQHSAEQADHMVDDILDMNNLFADLEDMAEQLCYEPETPEEKAWLREHMAERKISIAERKKQWVISRKADKERAKAELKLKREEEKKLHMIDE